MAAPKAGILWESYGPYHIARLEAVRKLFGKERVVGIEISPHTGTYDWARTTAKDFSITALVTDRLAEKVSSLTVYRRIKEEIKRQRIEVLFIPSYWPLSSFAALVAAKRAGVRAVMMNDSHFLTGRNGMMHLAIKRRLVSHFDSALVAGGVHRQFCRALGMANDRIVEGYDTVDNSYFANKAQEVRENHEVWRKRLGLPRKFILSLGRLVKKKNLSLVVDAYRELFRHGGVGGNSLVFVGSGPEKVMLLSAAKKWGLATFDHQTQGAGDLEPANEPVGVHFYPFAQIETTPAYYALASCFVLASQADEWGLVVNEAMASGCPVIVSRHAGCAADLVLHGKTGYVFNPKYSDQLSMRMRQICEDQAWACALGKAGQKHIAGWSNERFASNALRAAEIALTPIAKNSRTEAVKETSPSIAISQTCFPDYRAPVFEELSRRLPDRFSLVCGRDYFTRGVAICQDIKDWQWPVQNRFLLFRNLLWQHGAIEETRRSSLAVLELNPRIITNWLILIDRRLSGQKTILWGHIWAREGKYAWTNFIRLCMIQLSDGVISYTHTQADQLARVLPKEKITVAPNGLVSRRDCRAMDASAAELTDVVYVGRMIAEKKPRLLLRAFELAHGRLPENVRLVFVGAGPQLSALNEEGTKSPLASRVVFKGHVYDQAKIQTIYARAFCAVSPGYVGLSAVQSFAHGVPMVVADKEPHSPEIETCRDGFNTRFFHANRAEALADALVSMWRERETWYARREAISRTTGENYSVEAMVDGFMKALQDAGAN